MQQLPELAFVHEQSLNRWIVAAGTMPVARILHTRGPLGDKAPAGAVGEDFTLVMMVNWIPPKEYPSFSQAVQECRSRWAKFWYGCQIADTDVLNAEAATSAYLPEPPPDMPPPMLPDVLPPMTADDEQFFAQLDSIFK